jgi:hypothetical protein
MEYFKLNTVKQALE